MNNNIKVVEYTQGVGRSLNNIRNYNPRTTLHGKLSGKRLRVQYDEDSSAAYSGFFCIIDASTEEDGLQIGIVDGSGSMDEGYCGVFISGIDRIDVEDAILSVPTSFSTHYVVLSATYTPQDGETPASWNVEFSLSQSLPILSSTSFVAIIGYVVVDIENAYVSSIKQIYNNGVLYNNRYS